MVQVPLPGEQSALMGFRWQYDHIARLVYDGIVDADFNKIELAATHAGQVDDLLIEFANRRAAYQYKSGVSKPIVTFNELLRSGTTPGGTATDSPWRALAHGWELLRAIDDRPLTIHLVTAAVPSTTDHLTPAGNRPGPDHLRAFLARALEPLHEKSLELETFTEWAVPLKRLEEVSGLGSIDFREFLSSVRLETGVGNALEGASGSRREDIRSLSTTLLRIVSLANGAVLLSREQILAEMDWQERKSFRSIHEFPLDRSRYSPLSGGITLLQAGLNQIESGYVAITGPPGSGKSTLLTQALSAVSDRVVRYYAFVPGGGGSSRNRLSAEWFLHDLSTMLRNAGLQARQNQLTPATVSALRQMVSEQLDAASTEFAKTGRKTILVVDGLDHVQRDYSGNDALTSELLRPSELPRGVIVVVGTRDLAPLPSEAKQFVENRRTEVNLEHHRLSTADVLSICRADPSAHNFTQEVHELVANRCAGHPLALAYLLNQLEEFEGTDPVAHVRSIPAYDGDIAGQYRAVWDQLASDAEIVRVLRVCSRLRIGFEMDWIRTWTSDAATHHLLNDLRFLFRVERKRWRFFHDSFRQFARERTSLGENRKPDPGSDVTAHREVAVLCEASEVDAIRWQALFHRYEALQFDDVLRLATQAEFRRQFVALRSASEVTDDAKLALTAAANLGDFPALLRGLLVLSEIQDKSDELNEVDVCNTLLTAGRVEAAIDYWGDEQSLHVQLSHAYELASRLARQSNPAGSRIFESIHHFGLEQPGLSRGVNTDADVARGWARCAAHFLPVDIFVSRAKDVIRTEIGEREWEFDASYRLFAEFVESFVEEVSTISPENLETIDLMVQEEIGSLESKGLSADRLSRLGSVLGDLRYRVLAANVEAHGDFAKRCELFGALQASLKGAPVYQSTLLDMAFQEAEYASRDKALETLLRTQYGKSLTLDDLSASRNDEVIDVRLGYWTLRHELEISLGLFDPSGSLSPLESLRPSADTPAGDEITADATVHEFSRAIRLASEIDHLVRTLGLVSALVSTESDLDEEAVWSALGTTINLFPPFERSAKDWSSMHGLRARREKIYVLTIRTLSAVSEKLASRYEAALARRFENQPSEWPSSIQLELGLALHDEKINAFWFPRALSAFEAEAPTQGVNGALTDLTRLVEVYAQLDNERDASRVSAELARSAFGMGSRNDRQLQTWTAWLGRASGELGESELREAALWLARVIVAAEPLTDERTGGEELPAAIVSASPALALEVFEYMVGLGGISHAEGLAELLERLLASGQLNAESVSLVAELTGEVVAVAGNRAHPKLGKELRDRASDLVLDRLGASIRINALPTTRSTWLQSLFGSPSTDQAEFDHGDDEEYNSLELKDGTRHSRRQVIQLAVDHATLLSLVVNERTASNFKWVKVLGKNFMDTPIDQVVDAFDGSQHLGSALLWLANREMASGNPELATPLARQSLEHLPLDSWTSTRGMGRRRAIEILVSTDSMSPRDAAMDFAAFINEERWYSSMLHTDLDEILDAMSHGTAASEFWPVIREYLDGYTDRLDLPPPRSAPTTMWWAKGDSSPERQMVPLNADGVVGELTGIHLTHPTWPVREGIARVVVSALNRRSPEVENALARLVRSAVSDDVLEHIASCLAATESHPGLSSIAAEAGEILRTHPNMLVRRLVHGDLALEALQQYRSLPGSYGLALPDQDFFGSDELFDDGAPFLYPFEDQYDLLSEVADVDVNAMLAVAARYARDALDSLPSQAIVVESLIAASMRLSYPSNVVFASRQAFGRVFGDLVDAGLVGSLSILGNRMLRTGDNRLFGLPPAPRPDVMPSPPNAGHDQTAERWRNELDDRLDEYAEAARSGDRHLVAASSTLTVLNWPHLEEKFRCIITRRGSKKGPERLFNGRLADLSWGGTVKPSDELASLLVENNATSFMERRSDWLAIHPVLARSLGWVPDPNPQSIGGWLDGNSFAAGTEDWNDGTVGRAGPMFDDTISEGFATTMTPDALLATEALVGPLDLVLVLTRRERDENKPPRTVSRRIRLASEIGS